LASSQLTYLRVLGDGHTFNNIHFNRNSGTNALVHSQGQYNTFNNLVFRGNFGGTLIDQISSFNLLSNVIAAEIVPPGPAAGWVVDIRGSNNIITNVFSTDMVNGIRTRLGGATLNLVKNFRFRNGTTAIDDSSTANPKANRFVDIIDDANTFGFVTLVSAASVTPDGGSALIRAYELELADANVQLENVINTVVGAQLKWALRQDGAGGRALTFGTAYEFEAAAPALPVGSNDEYLLEGFVVAVDVNNVATRILCTRTAALV
jgi:hypothetical protein